MECQVLGGTSPSRRGAAAGASAAPGDPRGEAGGGGCRTRTLPAESGVRDIPVKGPREGSRDGVDDDVNAFRVGPGSDDRCPRERCSGKRCGEVGAEIGVGLSQPRSAWAPGAGGEESGRVSPRAAGGSVALPTPGFELPASGTGREHFLLLPATELWRRVTADPGDGRAGVPRPTLWETPADTAV